MEAWRSVLEIGDKKEVFCTELDVMLCNFVLPEYPRLNSEYPGLSRRVRVTCAEMLCHMSYEPTSTSSSAPCPSCCLSSPQNALLLLAFSPNQAMEERTTSSHQIHPTVTGASPEPRRRTTLTSFSITSTISSLLETKEKAIPKLLHLPQALKEEINPIYADATLLQQVAPCSCSTRHQ